MDGACATDGHAAQERDTDKTAQYAAVVAHGVHTFAPALHETYGRVGAGAWRLLQQLADIAAQSGDVSKARFKHNAVCALSCALCRGNKWVLHEGLQQCARASGRNFERGLQYPTAELA